jgi:hypothetical protein
MTAMKNSHTISAVLLAYTITIIVSCCSLSISDAFMHPAATTMVSPSSKSTEQRSAFFHCREDCLDGKILYSKDLTTLFYRNDDGNVENDATSKEDTSTANTLQAVETKEIEKEIVKVDPISNKTEPWEIVTKWYNSVTKQKDDNDQNQTQKRVPLPIQIQDTSVLYYDVFLLLNLSVSISFWVVHRLSFGSIIDAFSEGCLLSILWVLSGLYNGAFLYSAIDGHHDMTRDDTFEKGGPKAAGQLGLWTFVGTINLRMVVALYTAVIEHRPVGVANGEDLIPLELCFGLVLMSMWRMLHSSYLRV